MAILNSTYVEIDVSLVDAFRTASAELAKMKDTVEAIRNIIEAHMGDAEYACVDGEPVIRWSYVKRHTLDMDKLRGAVDPAVLAECYVDSVGRRFVALKTKTWRPDSEADQ